ncbi:MAG TPA: HD domain-containing protein [Thermoanaerobaculia bacterium]|jgi:hypothetical protein|nr:HD domain-containing protein [Thermoanaerobaculia bacterium]
MDRTENEFDRTLTMLFNRIDPPLWSPPSSGDAHAEKKDGKLVVLLGAGCSRQYGLPSFLELLTYLWEDFFRESPDPDWKLEVLRDLLDKYWQSQGPADRKRILDFYLRRVKGAFCPAYRRLAHLAKAGHIKAIVNMNFDTLLEEALEKENVDFRVSTSFRTSVPNLLMVYKPHGTIGDLPKDAIDGILNISTRLVKAAGSNAPLDDHHMHTELESFYQEHRQSVKQAPKLRREVRSLRNEGLRLYKLLTVERQENEKRLEEALKAVKASRERLGTLRKNQVHVRNDLILDIANSDLFSDPDEQQSAQEILTENDVLCIGYSGVDAKIAAALRAFSPGKDPRDKKLLVISPGRPDPRLLLVMAERGSQDLLITGEDATFENFMESLEPRLHSSKKSKESEDEQEPVPKGLEPTFMTRSERRALAYCLKIAMEIRLSLDVAERSATSVEEHGYTVFGLCLSLAKNVGICLSSPEKYLLHCAAFLHDLGYYRGYGRGRVNKNPGWRLLFHHGELTEELLREYFQDDAKVKSRLIPSSYREKSTPEECDHFLESLLKLCAWQTFPEPGEPIEDYEIKIGEYPAQVRFSLLHALFTAAEELPAEHPFLPSANPVRKGELRAIDDPVLDIYLGRKKDEVRYKIQRGRVHGELQAKDGVPMSATARWLLTMAARFTEKLDKVAKVHSGWPLEFWPPEFCCEGAPGTDAEFKPLVEAALEERLRESVKTVASNSLAEVTTLLDLIAIYTLSPVNQDEPRVALDNKSLEPIVQRVRERLASDPHQVQESLFPVFLTVRHHEKKGEMEKLFTKSFEDILHPAWRFCGRNWQNGIESVLMARACVDFGSSRFRSEVMGGVRDLLGEKVTWDEENPEHAYGHDRCTLCTARLLFIFTHARRLFPEEDLQRFANNSNKKDIDQTVQGLLAYMLSLPATSDIWWGLGAKHVPEGAIKSGDYLAWAARAVTHCLAIDREIRRTTGKDWLEEGCKIESSKVEALLRQRWDHLLGVNGKDLLSEGAEEPHSFIFGHIAWTCLDLQRLGPEIMELALGSDQGRLRTLSALLAKQTKQIGTLSRLSQFFLWPAVVLRDSLEPSLDSARELVKLCKDCVGSPVWIRKGPDRGTWGSNVKNTQTLATSLAAFWAYVYRDEENERRFKDVFENDAKERTGIPGKN